MKYFNFIKRTNILKGILYNRMVLYFILFISIINMTTISLMGDFVTPITFILVGVITSYFNKNMLVILTLSLAVSNILKYGKKIGFVSNNNNTEGLTTTKDELDEEIKNEKKNNNTEEETKPQYKNKETVNSKTKPQTNNNEETLQEFLNTQKDIKGIMENMDSQINQVTQQLDTMKKQLTQKKNT